MINSFCPNIASSFSTSISSKTNKKSITQVMICCCSPGRLTLLPQQFIRVRHLADNQINPERNNKFYRISSVCGFALETYIYMCVCIWYGYYYMRFPPLPRFSGGQFITPHEMRMKWGIFLRWIRDALISRIMCTFITLCGVQCVVRIIQPCPMVDV